MPLRVNTEVKDKLERLAHDTRRSRSFLAAEVVAAYVERELAITDGIQPGAADATAGRVVAHAEAMAQIYDVIDATVQAPQGVSRSVQGSMAALDDLKAQICYIAADNPAAARCVADRIGETAAVLGHLTTGRQGRVAGTYKKMVTGLPYLIAYAITPLAGRKRVSILRVIHAARDWPAENWPPNETLGRPSEL